MDDTAYDYAIGKLEEGRIVVSVDDGDEIHTLSVKPAADYFRYTDHQRAAYMIGFAVAFMRSLKT